jgi:hypothetical protein
LVLLAQIHNDELIGAGIIELGMLNVGSSDPKALALEAFYEMRSDEAAGTANKSCSHYFLINTGKYALF